MESADNNADHFEVHRFLRTSVRCARVRAPPRRSITNCPPTDRSTIGSLLALRDPYSTTSSRASHGSPAAVRAWSPSRITSASRCCDDELNPAGQSLYRTRGGSRSRWRELRAQRGVGSTRDPGVFNRQAARARQRYKLSPEATGTFRATKA